MPVQYHEVTEQLDTVGDYVRWGASRFDEAGLVYGHGTDNAVDEALYLVLHALHLQPGLPSELMHGRLTMSERYAVVELLEQRIRSRKPAPYLTHRAWFAGLEFYVDERVLIPRSPIAELIEHRFQPWVSGSVNRILDLCTGSGCIAVACAQAFPDADVDATDIAIDALSVAHMNVQRHQVEDRIRILNADLYAGVTGRVYDIIVSNPPYVGRAELQSLPAEYRHEPSVALGAGEEGLDIVQRILAEAPTYLSPSGILVVEVGNSKHALTGLFPEVPFTWPEFARGGGGVFLLEYEVLEQFHPLFAARRR